MALLFLCSLSGLAQEFEVATLKVSPPPAQDLIQINLGTAVHGRLTLTNASLSDCLRYAYGLVSDRQLQGPDWITSKAIRFDIVAQAQNDTDEAQLRVMLRRLLAERLDVITHTEKRVMSYLALTLSKGGSKLVNVPSDTVAPNSILKGRVHGKAMPLQRLAVGLSRFEKDIVVDETGLRGKYEIDLEWTPEDSKEPGEKPDLFTAVQQQLGLRLEKRKGPLDVIIVERAGKVPKSN